jgi:hypothetical protein
MRLNGREVPLPEQPFEGALRQIGAVAIRDGFIGGNGTNVLEVDVRGQAPQDGLPDGPDSKGNVSVVVTGQVWVRTEAVPPPPKAASAEGNAKRAKSSVAI